jgi:hypothetical protein
MHPSTNQQRFVEFISGTRLWVRDEQDTASTLTEHIF